MALRSRPLRGLAVSAALLASASAFAKAPTIEGLRLAPESVPQPDGDAFQRGRALLAINDVAGALAAFRQALLAAPQSTAAINGIAVCYDRLGRYDISRSYYEAALAIDPDSPVVLNNFGYSLYLQGDIDGAVTRLIAARDGGDRDVAAASQRTLTLIAALPHNAEPATGEAQIEVAPVAARIERTSASEVRLVLGTPPVRGKTRLAVAAAAPQRERAATVDLARAAPSRVVPVAAATTAVAQRVDVAAPATPAPAALAAREAHPDVALVDRAPALVAMASGASPPKAAEAPAVDVEMAAAIAVTPEWTARDDARLAALVAAQEAAEAVPPPAPAAVAAVAAPATPSAPPFDDGPATALAVIDPGPPPTPRRLSSILTLVEIRPPKPGLRPHATLTALPLRAAPSPWIVASQAAGRARPAVTAAITAPQRPVPRGGAADFASDDSELNAFAARMQGLAIPRDAALAAGRRDAAIARLEALVARVRRA